MIRNLGAETAEAIAEGRPYTSMEDLARRTPLSAGALEALATAGAFDCFGLTRREALWAAGALAGPGQQALLVSGRLERADGVAGIRATRLRRLPVPGRVRARNFH